MLNQSSSLLMGQGLNGRTSSIKLVRTSSNNTDMSKIDPNEKSLLDSLQRFIANEKLAEEVVEKEKIHNTMETPLEHPNSGENPIELIESIGSSSVEKQSRPQRHGGYNLSISEIMPPANDSME